MAVVVVGVIIDPIEFELEHRAAYKFCRYREPNDDGLLDFSDVHDASKSTSLCQACMELFEMSTRDILRSFRPSIMIAQHARRAALNERLTDICSSMIG